MFWFALAIGIILLATVILYNRLVAARNEVRNLWRQIDVQLKRRYDLIPNLVQAVRDVMTFEQETLRQVTEARARAMGAEGPAERAVADRAVSQALGQLFAVAERYPEIKSNENVRQLQADLTGVEDAIASARAAYNHAVRDYTNQLETVPSMFVAQLFGFEPFAYFEATEGDRAVPKVALR